MGDTDIGWTHRPGTRGRSWNPTQGCALKSEGCRNCYAMRMAARFAKDGWSRGLINLRTGKWNGEARLATHKIDEPLRWREPSTVFVNSMSDLFYEGFLNEQIAAVFGIMAACPQHTFIVLTKRAERLPQWFAWVDDETARLDWMRDPRRPNAAPAIHKIMEWLGRLMPPGFVFRENVSDVWPLPNVWIGVSVENREHGVPRIDDLRRTPAAIRLLSCEPLLEDLGKLDLTGISWLIDGCESGFGARPANEAWFRSLRDQCAVAGVSYFHKQMMVSGRLETDLSRFPEDLRIQDFPR
jgi:protein gp37